MSTQPKLIAAGRVVTCDPGRATPQEPLGAIEQGAVLIEGSCLAQVGLAADLLRQHPEAARIEHPDGTLTPGLVDAHTHAAWVGSRAREYAMRMAGAGYEQIAQAGGGIVASMRAVRAASLDEMVRTLVARLRRMAALGVTAVEVKSGYGLDEATERRQLEAVARAGEDASLPRLVPTFLGLHALPPEAAGDRHGYARRCAEWIEGIARDGLARFADAYVDRGAFSAAQARIVLARARELGLGVRLHAGQFADVGAFELAAELGAASVDHCEHLSEAAALQLGEAGVRAALLPVASFTLGQAPPPVETLRRAGVRLVVASDANPGTAPTESLPLALALGVRSYGLSVAEALLGATREAAASLGLPTGVLRPGAPADLVLWDLPEESAIVQPWGVPRVRLVMREGRAIAQAS
ncbi:MAG: imidazolonepropionase [Deltaproteobacteria bacterium]|nr:imidazolonepropionase [Deltaproteobacteria bacterium]